MALEVRICGWDRFLVRPIQYVTGPFGDVRKIPIRAWERVSGERLQEIATFLKINPTSVVAA